MTGAIAQVERSRPDVALVDYQLAEGDGLALCHELKRFPSPPKVLIYSAFAQPDLLLAAAVAGADGMLHKGASLDDLFGAIRAVASGAKALPPLRPEAIERTVKRLDPEDLPILGMRIDGATLADIASVLQLDEGELSRRVVAMLGRLVGPVGRAASA